jgi:outer membrane protein assembly factor BamA
VNLDTIQRALGIGLNKKLNWDRVQTGISELYKKNEVEVLRVELVPFKNGVKVVLKGSKSVLVKEVKFLHFPEDLELELKEKLALTATPEKKLAVDHRLVKKIERESRLGFESRGYFLSQTSVKVSGDLGEKTLEISAESGEPCKVEKIFIEGVSKEDLPFLKSTLKLREGMTISRTAIDDSIEAISLYLKKNQYSSVRIDSPALAFNESRTRVQVRFSVRMGNQVQFQFDGNTIYEEFQLRELVSDETSNQIEGYNQIAEKIEKKYKAVGYHFCKVTVEKIDDDKTRQIIVFRIDEGKKVKINKVVFSGTSMPVPESELRDLFFQEGKGVLSRGLFWEEGIPETIEGIKRQLARRGFINVRNGSPRFQFTRANELVDIWLDMEVGTQTYVTQVVIEGNKNVARSKILEILGVQEGSPLNKESYLEKKKDLLNFYHEQGFADVKISDGSSQDSDFEISSDFRSSKIVLKITEGTKYYVGNIQLDGLKKTKPHVIVRELKVKEGDVYDVTKLRQSEEALSTLGLFNRVELVATTDGTKSDRKDIKVVVQETKPGIGEVGLGAFYEDPRLRIRNFLGTAYKNLWGINHTASARTELIFPLSFNTGTKLIPFLEYSGTLGYRVPYPLEIPVTVTGEFIFDSFEVSYVDNISVIQSGTRLEGRIEKKLSSKLTGIYRLYHLERTKTEVLNDPTSEKIEVIGSTGPTLIVDLRDDIFNPTKGSLHTFGVELASPLLLSNSNISFVLASLRNTFFIPVLPSLGLTLFAGGSGLLVSVIFLPITGFA